MGRVIQVAVCSLLSLNSMLSVAHESTPSSIPATGSTSRFAAEDAAAVAYGQPLIAFTHVQVVDGTGGAAQHDMTVLVKDGRIAALAPAQKLKVPTGATVIDGRDKTLLPGFVMVHEHLFYPSIKPGVYLQLPYSFSRLYLAGGTTTMRTGGTFEPETDLNIRRAIESGRQPGPDMDVTGPYLGGPSEVVASIPLLAGPDNATSMVNFWVDRGVTSFKAYTSITRDELRAAVLAAHARGVKVTGHLCSITYREAAQLGIDNLEHSFEVMTDFVPRKTADACPEFQAVVQSIAQLDPDGAAIGELMDFLIERKVALTSTLTISQTLAAGQPPPPAAGLELLAPEFRAAYERMSTSAHASPIGKSYAQILPNIMRMERRFVSKGGLLLAGTDPTGFGGVVPGYSARRQLEIMVQAGMSFPDALKIATLNGASYLGRQANVGSIEVGKRADLLLIDGDPVKDAAALARMPLVFKAGIGFRSQAIFDALKGKVGLF